MSAEAGYWISTLNLLSVVNSYCAKAEPPPVKKSAHHASRVRKDCIASPPVCFLPVFRKISIPYRRVDTSFSRKVLVCGHSHRPGQAESISKYQKRGDSTAKESSHSMGVSHNFVGPSSTRSCHHEIKASL